MSLLSVAGAPVRVDRAAARRAADALLPDARIGSWTATSDHLVLRMDSEAGVSRRGQPPNAPLTVAALWPGGARHLDREIPMVAREPPPSRHDLLLTLPSDDLIALTDDPVHQDPAAVFGRAVAVGHALGAAAGLRETDRLRDVLGERTAGTPSAATCTSCAATSLLPPRRTPSRPPGHERRRARPLDPSGRPRAGRRAI